MAHVMPQPARPSPPSRGAPRRRRWRNTLIGWSFILPNFLGFAAVHPHPGDRGVRAGLHGLGLLQHADWVGLAQLPAACGRSDRSGSRCATPLYYAVGHIPLTLVASLGLAMLLNRKLRGVGFFRTAAFFPYITSLVAVAVVWNMLFSPDGGPDQPVPAARSASQTRPGWTSSTDWAMPAVIITSVWRDMGYYMVLFLAGLQTIPTELLRGGQGGRRQRLAAVLERHHRRRCGPPPSSCWSC